MYRTDISYKREGLLFHFTKAESLMKMLESMTLRLSSFTNLNDLNEIELNCSYTDSMLNIKHRKYILEHCKLLSFSQNYKVDNSYTNIGYNHPRMWAQYAEDNKGVCIVIDEKRFLEKNATKLEGSLHVVENVSYKDLLYDKNINSSDFKDSNAFLKEHYRHIFFNKHLDWEREHERRLFGIDIPEYLSIDGCIEFACLGRNFQEAYIQQTIEIISRAISKHEQILTPHDFVKQTNSDGRIMVLDYAHAILSNINKLATDMSTYKAYLISEGYEDLDKYC